MTKITHSADLNRPIIGLSCCSREINNAKFHAVANVYIQTLMTWSHCDVVLVPAFNATPLGEASMCVRAIVSRLDGIVLTGSRSMVDPRWFGKPRLRPETQYDPNRDSTTLELIGNAVQQEVPLLGICRGFQEICCAFGGSLYDNLSDIAGLLDHIAPQVEPIADRYLPLHKVACVTGRRLAAIADQARIPSSFAVNSLHQQGVASITERLAVEAIAADGLIEAVSVIDAKSFMVGVQWHPEWHVDAHPFNRMLFQTFGNACRERLHALGNRRVMF